MTIGSFKLNSISKYLAPAGASESTYLVVGTDVSPFILTYAIDSSTDTFTKVANSATAPSQPYGIKFNPAGTSVSMLFGNEASNVLGVYNFNQGVLSNITISDHPGQYSYGADYSTSWNNDGSSLAIISWASPNVRVYNRSADTFTRISNIFTTANSGGCRSVSWNPDGTLLAVGWGTGDPDYLAIYSRSGNSFTKIWGSGGITIPSQPFTLAWSPDGNYLLVGLAGGGAGLYILKRSGNSFSLCSVDTTPYYMVYGAAWSLDGNTVIVSYNNTNGTYIYSRNGDSFTYTQTLTSSSAAAKRGITWSRNGKYVAMVNQDTPYLQLWKVTNGTFTKLSTPSYSAQNGPITLDFN